MSILSVKVETAATVTGRPTPLEEDIFDIHVGRAKTDNEVDFEAKRWVRDAAKFFARQPRMVGGGSYAVVYEHPKDKNKIIKVVHKPDPCWRYYAQLRNKLPQDERVYVPKMYASVVNDDGTSVHVMERLLEADDASLVRKSFQMDPYPWGWFYLDGLSISGFVYHELVQLYGKGLKRLAHPRVEEHPLTKLVTRLNAKCHLDINDKNIMFRSNGELVLNDPVAGLI